MPTDPPAPAVADHLFGLPVGEFVAARDDLVRRLKADGSVEEAATVKALRRPTLAAWAVNQVVRVDHATYDQLVSAGADLQQAQRRALSGVRDTGLREAGVVRRRLVEDLTDRASEILVDAGARPDSHLDDVAASFEAASADRDVADLVGAGRLSAPVTVEADLSGTGALLAMSLDGATARSTEDGEAADSADAERRREAMRMVEAARARAESSATAARQARQEAASLAEQEVESQRRAAATRETAQRAAEEAAAAANRARRANSDARTAAELADADADAVLRARAALDELA